MSTKRNVKKLRASFVAGTLAAAIALTGTFAWTSMTQMQRNEFHPVANPGGRLHDDFNGLNKDIYAENFTELGTGMPIFVRVRLSEYMEEGRHAGIYRDGLDNGDPRDVEVLTPARDETDATTNPADINDEATWPIHKPGDTVNKSQDTYDFHETWQWDFGGSTTYMPTFNKNQDSLSVDVNGTYVGTDGIFEKGEPYDDYVSYTTDASLHDEANKIINHITADAYYDADDDDKDEWIEDGTGGPNGAGGALGTNYTTTEETHEAKTTRGATVLTMAEWQAKGSPIGDYWVWDTDGWAYWAAPLMPTEATGALLTGVRQIKETENCYYAISVEGQFSDAQSFGKPADTGAGTEATGFYIDGITPEAIALLEQAAKVIRGKDGKWYINQGNNIFQQLDSATGQMGAKICAGLDRTIGTTDDKTGIIETAEDVTIPKGDTDPKNNYGKLFLAPDEEYPYYRAMGDDDLLGTDDDVRIWVSGSFPDGDLSLTGAGKVKITAPDGATDKATGVAGGTLAFKAEVFRDEAGTDKGISQDVIWSVTGGTNANTHIDDKGVLTIAPDQQTDKTLTVRAAAKADDRIYAEIPVTVLAKDSVTVTVTSDSDTIKALKDGSAQLQLTATVKEGITEVVSPTIEWSVTTKSGLDGVTNITADNGLLKVPYTDKTGVVTVTATYKYTPAGGTETVVTGTKDITVTSGDVPVVTINGDKTIQAGEKKTYSISLDVSSLGTGAKWSVVRPTTGVVPTIVEATGELSVPDTMKANAEIEIKAVAQDSGAQNAEKTLVITVAPPANKPTITPSDTKVKKGASITLTGKLDGYASQQLTWTTTAGTLDKSATASSSEKVTLTVPTSVTATEITVTATSLVDSSKSTTQKITVGGDGVDIGSITPGSTTTVKIDNIEWYVLAKNGDTALILSKNILEDQQFNSSNVTWDKSSLRTYLNGTWLNGKATLKQYAQATSIQVRSSGNSTSYNAATSDKVFLLSEADVFGTENYGRMSGNDIKKAYTPGVTSALKAPGGSWAATGGSYNIWWLRSPSVNTSGGQRVAYVYADGTVNYGNALYTNGVRPALWVKIQ